MKIGEANCKKTNQKKMAEIEGIKMIDPPSGWMFGFPKAIPNDVTDVDKWLVENGYPQKMIDDLGEYFFVRVWIK